MATNGKNTIHTLILSGRIDVIDQLQRILATDPAYQAKATNSAESAQQTVQTSRIDVILIDDVLADGAPLDVIRKLTTTAPHVPIVALADMSAVTFVREALLAGARAFIQKPLQEAEVLTSLNQLVQMEALRRTQLVSATAPLKSRRQIITVMSPKGGVGTTMLAVNLAVLLRKKTKASVILVESQGSLGDLEPMLNLHAQFTCGDMLGRGEALDIDMINGIMTEHHSGIKVLVSSRQLEDNALMTADRFEALVQQLTELAEYVVIDGGSLAEEQTAVTLSMADVVLLVTTPEVSALRRISLFLEAATRSGFTREKLRLVVNRDGEAGGIPSKDIGQHLSMKVAATIPDDTGLVVDSLNRGIPLVLQDARSAVARSIDKLADLLAHTEGNEQTKNGKPSGLRGRLTNILNFSPA